MATKASAILIAVFLLTLPVLAGNARPTVTPASSSAAQATAEATPEATAVILTPESATSESTEAALVGDPARGQDIFEHGLNGAPACVNCHNRANSGKVGFAIGPGLKTISERAAVRVEGLTAPEYIEQSIRTPSAFVVPGFQNIMYNKFAHDYSDQDIADLVAYLLTL
jgi:cytochrome c2